MAALAAAAGALGVYLVYTAVVFGQTGLGRRRSTGSARGRAREWLIQAGLSDVDTRQFAGAVAALAVAGAVAGYLVFGGVVAAAVAAGLAGGLPVASYRARRARLLEQARDEIGRAHV